MILKYKTKMNTITITQSDLSELLHLYHQGRNDLAQNQHCYTYENWLESQFGQSYFYLENYDINLYQFEYTPEFYLHIFQSQPEIITWLETTKEELEDAITYQLKELISLDPQLSPIELLYQFCDELNFDISEITKSCFLYKTILNFSNQTLLSDLEQL